MKGRLRKTEISDHILNKYILKPSLKNEELIHTKLSEIGKIFKNNKIKIELSNIDKILNILDQYYYKLSNSDHENNNLKNLILFIKNDLKQFFENWLKKSIFERINNTRKNIFIEIGTGTGDYIVNLAKYYNKDLQYIGIDYYDQALFRAAKKAYNLMLNNIFFINIDANIFINCIKDIKFDTVLIPFPDPWHKKKHKKRRLINKNFINKLHNLLKNNSKLIILTDNIDYALSINLLFKHFKEFKSIFIKNENEINQKIKNYLNTNLNLKSKKYFFTNDLNEFKKIFPFYETSYYLKSIKKGNITSFFIFQK